MGDSEHLFPTNPIYARAILLFYIEVGRKIERHSLVDTEYQENQWALWAFTANLVSDKVANRSTQPNFDSIFLGLVESTCT